MAVQSRQAKTVSKKIDLADSLSRVTSRRELLRIEETLPSKSEFVLDPSALQEITEGHTFVIEDDSTGEVVMVQGKAGSGIAIKILRPQTRREVLQSVEDYSFLQKSKQVFGKDSISIRVHDSLYNTHACVDSVDNSKEVTLNEHTSSGMSVISVLMCLLVGGFITLLIITLIKYRG